VTFLPSAADRAAADLMYARVSRRSLSGGGSMVSAAVSISSTTAPGCETYIAWLPGTSTVVEPARRDIALCASGGIILWSVATRYQIGFDFQAGT
jgi:hypothetical protein